MKIKIPEAQVLRACLDYLRARGHMVIRVNNGAFKTERGGFFRSTDVRGCADIMGLTISGRGLAVECKSNTGRQSPAQREFMDGFRNRGGLYVLARSVDDLIRAGL